METVSERLRRRHEALGDGKSTWRRVPVCQEGADTIDALVAALTKAQGYVPDSQWHLSQEIDAAFALARKGG